MRILVVAQDLRISGTSEGIVSRSFIYKLKECYPDFKIDVFYLKNHTVDVKPQLLGVDNYDEKVIYKRIPVKTILLNKPYWRLTGISLKDLYIEKIFGQELRKIDSSLYDLVFLRSAGTAFELILGATYNPKLLEKSIINFHDPFPGYWDTGSQSSLTNLELQKLKRMQGVVDRAQACISPSKLLSQDLEFLYGTRKKFHTLPHQFTPKVFDLKIEDKNAIRKKRKSVCITYHGAIQLGRSLTNFLDVYVELVDKNPVIKKETEVFLRIKGEGVDELKMKYNNHPNIEIRSFASFNISFEELKKETDIGLILENNSSHSNILPGKVPVLIQLKKYLFILGPERSELKRLAKEKGIFSSYRKNDIAENLILTISQVLNKEPKKYELEDYFSQTEFRKKLNYIINTTNSEK
ncbi:hypothetical protein LDL76_01800 [Salegentibacter mishustinae]|uniref:hypothetical protein n=1 Tax=Salegentibacter mishustinae TaxID=270918 RepID=UPI001CE07266|nr:hypothetical protein [Salegentibacter mishustinae]UBZ07452.1 hypothetical protein LDL76_01800 [Salegentibacter mishustinae]